MTSTHITSKVEDLTLEDMAKDLTSKAKDMTFEAKAKELSLKPRPWPFLRPWL